MKRTTERACARSVCCILSSLGKSPLAVLQGRDYNEENTTGETDDEDI